MSKNLQIKVCGIGDQLKQIDQLGVDYIGHIFWDKSSRYVGHKVAEKNLLAALTAKRIGVFVNASLEELLRVTEQHQLDGVQLHGQEGIDYLTSLRTQYSGLIFKAFSVSEQIDFSTLNAYTDLVDLFVFDTAGKLPGGNGHPFNWKLLEAYKGSTKFLLSGGIGAEQLSDLKAFFQSTAAEKCIGLDLNSRFEIRPAHKDIPKLANFITQIKSL